jgi:hypothetical protein
MTAKPCTTVALLIALFSTSVSHAQSSLAPHHDGGIWKAAVPPQRMTGEFESLDPLGVAVGARIIADCSLNWTDPDDGRLYCFASGTSLEFFLDRPAFNIQRARLGWTKLAAQPQ